MIVNLEDGARKTSRSERGVVIKDAEGAWI